MMKMVAESKRAESLGIYAFVYLKFGLSPFLDIFETPFQMKSRRLPIVFLECNLIRFFS